MAEAGRSRLEQWFAEHGVSEKQLVVGRHTARGIRSSVSAALVARGSLDAEQVGRALSEVYDLPRWDGRIDESLVERLTVTMCRRELLVPVAMAGSRLVLAVADPTKHDVLEIAAHACRARGVDLVVAAEPSLLAALDSKIEGPDFAALAVLLARHKAVEARHEARLREQRERLELDESITTRIANLLLLALVRGPVTAARFRPDVDAPIEMFQGGRWSTDARFGRLPLRPALLREVAIHLTAMAGMTKVDQNGVSTIHLVVGRTRAWHGGEVCAVDIDLEGAQGGMVVVLSRAAVRYGELAYGEVERDAFAPLDRFHDTVSPTTLTEARRELELAEAKLVALDGPSANLGFALRLARARFLECEGDLEKATQAFEAALECTDVPFGNRSFPVTEALRCALALGRFAGVVAPARTLMEGARAHYGVPGVTELFVSQLLARAHFAMGDALAGEAVLAEISRWARPFGDPAPLYFAWLTGLSHRARGRLAAAEGELRSALDELNAAGDALVGPPIDGYLHIDLAQVLAAQQRKDEAARILDRAKDLVRLLAPSHPARTAVDRAVAALAGVHPYR
jgi:tetratricopeptide (TPR) repeat protein